MLRTILGFLLILAAFGVAFLTSMPVVALLEHLTGNETLARAVGTGAWILGGTVLTCYISLYLDRPLPAQVGLHQVTPSGKLETAAFRMSFIFAMVSGAVAEIAGANTPTTALVAVGCAVLGGLLGYDVQRRARRRRTDAKVRQPQPLSTQTGDQPPTGA